MLLFLATRHGIAPARRRLGYAAACALVLIGVAVSFSGCGGGSSTGGKTPLSHVDSITAVYSGDTVFASSTSTAVPVTVTQ